MGPLSPEDATPTTPALDHCPNERDQGQTDVETPCGHRSVLGDLAPEDGGDTGETDKEPFLRYKDQMWLPLLRITPLHASTGTGGTEDDWCSCTERTCDQRNDVYGYTETKGL